MTATTRKPRFAAFTPCSALSICRPRVFLPAISPLHSPRQHACSRAPCHSTYNAPPTAVLGRRQVALSEVSPAAARASSIVAVEIERPRRDIRKIRACVLVNATLPVVWGLLSDYGTLSEHIPNLAESAVLSQRSGRARVSQCGVQNILGFTFRASVTMDMREVQSDSGMCRAIEFGLVESRDFKIFHGVWRAERVAPDRTALFYDVTVSPRGLVPVRAIEWRIAEDVPDNLEAVKRVCERRQRGTSASRRGRNGVK